MDLNTTFKRYGFSDSETAVYLYILKNGDCTVFSISKDTKIPRTTVYSLLEHLLSLGVISTFKKNNVSYFSAESPKKLIKILKEKEEMMLACMPSLLALSRSKELNPTVRFYSGKESIKDVFKNIYDDLTDKKVNKLYTVSHPELQEFFPKYLPELLKLKRSLGIHTSLIAPASFVDKLPASYVDDEYRETRFLPEEFPFRGTLMIAADRIAIFTMQDENTHAIVIDSPVITNMLKQFFLFTWATLEKKN
ncbi:hypothetical protein EB052_00835 [bacterium]|nr:hypothetical protein [bacterium]